MPRNNSTPDDRANDKAEREDVSRYTTESRPDLPTANVTHEYPTPTISREMIEIRNREAREQAARIARSRQG